MATKKFSSTTTAWCPGCGNFQILETMVGVLNDLDLDPHKLLLVGGIGQAAKTNQYINANGLSGLHGRGLPAAVGAKIANPELTVIMNSGDGDSYGEGGNHFIHTIRRNVDMTHFIHDNQIYGLTTGQVSPTSETCTPDSRVGTCNLNIPLHPLHLALASGATFVARGFSGHTEQLAEIMKAAILHEGHAVVDIMQPCVTFNRVNTFAWYNKRATPISEDHDATDFDKAIALATQWGEEIPTGILYQVDKPTFHQRHGILSQGVNLSEIGKGTEKAEILLESFM